jgi:hypothetical protein
MVRNADRTERMGIYRVTSAFTTLDALTNSGINLLQEKNVI